MSCTLFFVATPVFAVMFDGSRPRPHHCSKDHMWKLLYAAGG